MRVLFWFGGIAALCAEEVHWIPCFSPGCGDDLVSAGNVGEAAVLWNQAYTVRALRAGKGEMAQKGHHEDKNLHTGKRLSHTGSLPCKERAG